MNDFMREYWTQYLAPVGFPMVVFIASFFGTNIGWAAFPIGIVVCGLMAVLTTVKIRTRERDLDRLMAAIKASGTAIKVPRQ
jgi:uncharacterized membrane protein (DUF485 family)